jgi:hypothetical protein
MHAAVMPGMLLTCRAGAPAEHRAGVPHMGDQVALPDAQHNNCCAAGWVACSSGGLQKELIRDQERGQQCCPDALPCWRPPETKMLGSEPAACGRTFAACRRAWPVCTIPLPGLQLVGDELVQFLPCNLRGRLAMVAIIHGVEAGMAAVMRHRHLPTHCPVLHLSRHIRRSLPTETTL